MEMAKSSSSQPTRTREARGYQFDPAEQRGLLAGWQTSQVVLLVAGLLIAVGLFRLLPSALGLFLALAAVSTSIIFVYWSVSGRKLSEWVVLGMKWMLNCLAGQNINTSKIPHRLGSFTTGGYQPKLKGTFADQGLSSKLFSTRVGQFSKRNCPPKPFEAFQLLEVPSLYENRPIGVVYDGLNRRYSAVIGLASKSFMLFDTQEKTNFVEAWAGLLSSLARQGTPITRVQWVERNIPDYNLHCDEPDQQPESLNHNQKTPSYSRNIASDSYLELVAKVKPSLKRHEVLVVLSTKAENKLHNTALIELLVREVYFVERRLAEMGMICENRNSNSLILGPRALAVAIRRAFDSALDMDNPLFLGDSPFEEYRNNRQNRVKLAAEYPWPMGIEAHWGEIRVDSTWHSTYWIAQWPRVDMPPDFLAPFLLEGSMAKAISVVMQPLDVIKALRDVAQARTATVADEKLRHNSGFLPTFKRQKEQETLYRRESELTEGHGQYRFSGYVTVRSQSKSGLAHMCEQIEQLGARSHLELRKMYGEQAKAFVFSLPLARGLS